MKAGMIVLMFVLGLVALAVPGWLFEVRSGVPVVPPEVERVAGPRAPGGTRGEGTGATLRRGFLDSLLAAREGLQEGRRSEAAHALDAAMRIGTVAKHAAPGPDPFEETHEELQRARHALQIGRPEEAIELLGRAVRLLSAADAAEIRIPSATGVEGYDGAHLLDARGVRIGEVEGVEDGEAVIVLGGARDVWGLFDLGTADARLRVPADRLVFGPARFLNTTLVAAPVLDHAAVERVLGGSGEPS